jgi:hypothetical protein
LVPSSSYSNSRPLSVANSTALTHSISPEWNWPRRSQMA